ncbi:MAG: hypothetical protein ACUVQ0_03170 [Thermoproteota archaeon]
MNVQREILFRRYSQVYEAILKAVADGKQVSTEIASYLYSLKLIPAEDPSHVHPYLQILNGIGLFEKVKAYERNKYYYRHLSPIMDYYYLDAKYGISERDLHTRQARKVLEVKIPYYVEQFIMNLMSKALGFWPEKIIKKNQSGYCINGLQKAEDCYRSKMEEISDKSWRRRRRNWKDIPAEKYLSYLTLKTFQDALRNWKYGM